MCTISPSYFLLLGRISFIIWFAFLPRLILPAFLLSLFCKSSSSSDDPCSNNAMLSTCPVCGNIFMIPAAFNTQPPSLTRILQSRASVAGLQETYTILSGRSGSLSQRSAHNALSTVTRRIYQHLIDTSHFFPFHKAVQSSNVQVNKLRSLKEALSASPLATALASALLTSCSLPSIPNTLPSQTLWQSAK